MNSQTQEIVDFLLEKKDDGAAWPWGQKIDLAAQELAARYLEDNNLTNPVLQTLEKMDQEGETSAKYFADEIEKSKTENYDEDPEKWEVFLPFQVEFEDSISQDNTLEICDVEFRFVDTDYVEKKISFDPTDRRQVGRSTGRRVSDPETEAFLAATTYAESRRAAWKNIEP